MRAAGIPLPAIMICAEDVLNGKPHPSCYLKAASLFDVLVSECLVFEDAAAGIQAGPASGARVIAVNPSASVAAAAHVISEMKYLSATVGEEGIRVTIGDKTEASLQALSASLGH